MVCSLPGATMHHDVIPLHYMTGRIAELVLQSDTEFGEAPGRRCVKAMTDVYTRQHTRTRAALIVVVWMPGPASRCVACLPVAIRPGYERRGGGRPTMASHSTPRAAGGPPCSHRWNHLEWKPGRGSAVGISRASSLLAVLGAGRARAHVCWLPIRSRTSDNREREEPSIESVSATCPS